MGLRLEGAALPELLPNPAHRRHAKTQKFRDLAGAFVLLMEPDDTLARGKRHRSHDGLYHPASPKSSYIIYENALVLTFFDNAGF
jgi:hypothetical protein